MTDNELKFFDPETGKPLHRVPQGGVIKKHTPYGYVKPNGMRGWIGTGPYCDIKQGDDTARFTREPIAPPLPTEPGSLIRAVNTEGDECATMIRLEDGDWVGVDQDGDDRFWGDKSITSWEPMTAIPTETWDRLRVIDPEDKRDRVDGGAARPFDQLHDVTYFTREPIAPPLPTEPGYYTDRKGTLWELRGGHWSLNKMHIGPSGDYLNKYAPFTPASIVPTETWDRLRVLDPEDKRDRVDGCGKRWVWSDAGYWKDVPGVDSRTSTLTLASAFGPLRFADEVSDR